MNQIFITLSLTVFGLCMGSFAGALVWRLRSNQLKIDKKLGDKVDKSEYRRLEKLNKFNIFNDRSVCLDCSYRLKWYDLIPLVSWLILRGRCRSCHKPIGYMEPLIELGVALFFALSYIFWPYSLNDYLEISRFIIWLISGIGLAVLFAYDAKWFLLPDKINYAVIGLGFINSIIVVILSNDISSTIFSIIGSVMILSGFYWFIYIFSRGMWIGFGDIKLGLGLALLLADWRLAFLALFSANLVGCLVVIPGMLMGKLSRKSHVPFGPMLILGFFIAAIAGNYLIDLYFFSLY